MARASGWRGPDEPGEYPTLGYEIADWIEASCVIPDGDHQGEPFGLTDEMLRFLLRYYRLHPEARYDQRRPSAAFAYRGGLLMRPQKWGKGPFAAALCLAETFGPVRFDGWDADGEPVGRPHPTPWVQIVATSEEQTDNTWLALYEMASRGAVADLPGVDIGVEDINLPSGGKIEPRSSSGRARLGARLTFGLFDEALALDTPLPTPGGWTTMGDVRAGDQLIGADGRPTTVLKTTDVQNDRLCYRVTFADGTSVVASDGHLWQTKVARSAALPRVRTTGEMAADGRRFQIPVAAPLKAPEVPLPLDPYLLGLWLGDGSRGQGYITAHPDDAAWYVEQIKAAGEFAAYRPVPNRTGRISLGERRGPNPDPPSVKQRLRLLGILDDKCVPAVYLRASVEQRLALLQGLMDTDGHVSKLGNCTFSGAEQVLVDGVQELLRSLGQSPSLRWYPDSRARTGGCFKLHFTPRGIVPFRLPRKAERVRTRRQTVEWVAIAAIEPVPAVPVRCVAVDAPDSLFLAGDGWQVTHNTHLFTESNGGVNLASTMKRNIGGMGGRWLETTNAYDPSEKSVAQRTHEHEAPDVLVDYRPPPRAPRQDDDEDCLAMLAHVYGDSWWVDKDRVLKDARDPNVCVTWADALRFFFNLIVVGISDAVDPIRWDTLARDRDLEPDDIICLGFDGSRSQDCTSLVASRLRDGRWFHLRTWDPADHDQCPNGVVPRGEVDRVIADTFEAYEVLYLYMDPYRWQEYGELWAGRYPGQVVEFPTNVEKRMDDAIVRFQVTLNGGFTHDGDPLLRKHAFAAAMAKGRKRAPRPDEDPAIPRFYQRIMPKVDKGHIDALVAGILAEAARGKAIEDGALNVPDFNPGAF